MEEAEHKKKILLANFINFLQRDINQGDIACEKKEALEVAMQCLEAAYEINSEIKQKAEGVEKIDLLSFIKPQDLVVTEEDKARAVEYKNKGNEAMKNLQYSLAIEEYTKAIQLNPKNAVYFCNRAAAFSRLEQNEEAINDCKKAIGLEPTYGKAYGRLGIAYSNLNRFNEAREAYQTALKYDPNNTTYETNLKLAQEKCFSEADMSGSTAPVDIAQFINNPALISVATQMLGDPNFRSMMSTLMNSSSSGEGSFDALFQAGHTLASRMNSANPTFVESFRRAVNERSSDPSNTANENPQQNDTQHSSQNLE